MSTSRTLRSPGRLVPLVAGLLLSVGLAGCSDDGADKAEDPGGSDSPASSQSSPAADGPTCTYSSDGTDPAKKVDLPPEQATVAGTVPMTVTTNAGTIGVELDADNAPCTVNSFVSLASQGYFDDTRCHRLVTAGIYVLQCGDPTYSGSGGPGYSFEDELSGSETYGAGTLAMANAGPDTNGSQFFMVYKNSPLPPSYTVFGQIDPAGVKVLKGIAKQGSDNAFGQGDGHPTSDVTLESVTAAD